MAAVRGYVGCLQPLLEKGADKEAKYNIRGDEARTALHVAAREGHADCLEVLLLGGADVDGETEVRVVFKKGGRLIPRPCD